MNKRVIKAVTWVLGNIGVLGIFIYANTAEVSSLQSGLLNISVFYYWVLNIAGLFAFTDVMAESATKDKSHNEKMFVVPQPVDVTVDIVILCVMVYFGFFLTGAFYLLHILGTNVFRTNVLKIMQAKKDEHNANLRDVEHN